MADRPILFQGAMVRALLSGTKTQTRRLVKPQFPPDAEPEEMCATTPEGWQAAGHSGRWWNACDGDEQKAVPCPYGQPGDRLWVRESFMHNPAEYEPLVSNSVPLVPAETFYMADHTGDSRGLGWKPSIHMPRKLSRITLEIVGVRVERLRAITEADAQAEGVERDGESFWRGYAKGHYDLFPDARGSYASLWVSINGEGSWDANPWVWVVEFKRITP